MDGSLIVVDMRGPKIILSNEANSKKNKHKRQSIRRTHGGDGPSSPSSGVDIAKSLTWTISPLDKGKPFFLSQNYHVNLFLFPSKIAS